MPGWPQGISRPAEAGDDRIAGSVREVDVEAAARRVRGKRQAEQAALAAGKDDAAHVEEVGGLHCSVAHGSDPPRLFDDELHAAIDRILDERDRRREAGRVDPRAEQPVCATSTTAHTRAHAPSAMAPWSARCEVISAL